MSSGRPSIGEVKKLKQGGGSLVSTSFASEYSLSEISRRSGISVGYLSLILRGKRKNVSLAILTRLAFALNKSVNDLKEWIMEVQQKEQGSKGNISEMKEGLSNEGSFQVNEDEVSQLGEREKEKAFQAFILETLESLEFFDPNRLQELRKEVIDCSLLCTRRKGQLLYWIEGILAAQKNQFQEALEKLGRARYFKATHSLERRMLAKIHGGMGSCYIALGDHKQAFRMLTKSLNIWGRGTDAALVYLNMGTLYRRAHQFRYSRQAYLQALEMGSLFIRIMAYSGLGQIAIDQKDLVNARIYLLSGYKLSRHEPITWGVPELYCNMGIMYKFSGQYNKAKIILAKALRGAEAIGAVRVKHYILLEQGEIFSRLMQSDQANAVFLILENELSEAGDLFLLGKTLLNCAQNVWETSKVEALEYLLKSYRTLGQIGTSRELMICCQMLAEGFTHCGTPELGDFYRDEVKRIKRKLLSI